MFRVHNPDFMVMCVVIIQAFRLVHCVWTWGSSLGSRISLDHKKTFERWEDWVCITICTACFYYHFYVDSPGIFLILGQNFLVYVSNDWIVMFVDLSPSSQKTCIFPPVFFHSETLGCNKEMGCTSILPGWKWSLEKSPWFLLVILKRVPDSWHAPLQWTHTHTPASWNLHMFFVEINDTMFRGISFFMINLLEMFRDRFFFPSF